MRRIRQRVQWAVAKLALIATTGVVFQTGGCEVDPSLMVSDLTNVFLNTLISGWVNNQFGVTNSMFY